jgi:lipopolysaccharide transport system ATP-binding protein
VSAVISVERLSKCYRLGAIGGGTLREDLSRWWAKLRKRADPSLKIGEEHRARHVGQNFWALQDVSFKVDEGDVLAIIGRNGAGKSTLLKILSRVTAPSSGVVKTRGRIASLLEVGTGFHPELTGRENVFLNGTILGMTKAEIRAKFDEIVSFSEIEDFIDTPVKRYSSGMYVRLAFSVAAHLESEILIVDEALAVGDAQFQKKCVAKMGDLSRAGRTVLFVSHNLDALRNLCRGAVVIDRGRLVFSGSVEEAVEEYLGSGTRPSREITFERPEAVPTTPFLCSACILNHAGSASAPIDTRHGFGMELTYEIPRPMSNLELSIRVSTS